MSPSHRDVLAQLEAITTYDGFVSTLVDIRDSMLFYDRDLMLAGYTSAVESLVASTLATACLEGDAEAEQAFAAVRKVVDEFPLRFQAPESPVDVEAVIEAFLRLGAWVLRERVSACTLAFSRYIHGDYDVNRSVDGIVAAARGRMATDPDEALDRVGEAGALMLRGQLLRPRWLVVVDPRMQLWLAGLRNMAGQIASTFKVFPWGPIEQERARKPLPEVVVDLQAFRKRRFMAMEAWQPVVSPQPRDEVDALVERVWQGPQALDRETLSALERAGEQAVPLLVATVEARHLVEGPDGDESQAVIAAIRALAHLRRHEVVTRLIELVTNPATPRDVGREARDGLERLGGLAVDGLNEYLRRTPAPQGGATLARLLTRMPRGEKTFRALVELFQRLRWEDGKLAVAAALAEYGDGRAVPVLQQALHDPQLPAGRERRELEGVVRRLRGPRASRRRVAKG